VSLQSSYGPVLGTAIALCHNKHMIYIAADHAGFELKNELINYFSTNNIEFEDLGPYEFTPDDDYTEYVLKLVERVRYNENSLGILLCRNGVGVSMLANKFKGIRCALTFSSKHAVSAKNDDNTNVLALPADYLEKDAVIETVKSWVDAPFSSEERHLRRVNRVNEFGQE
jgi:RpiB/LacA/LacB family sugar-phosphate isomerase